MHAHTHWDTEVVQQYVIIWPDYSSGLQILKNAKGFHISTQKN